MSHNQLFVCFLFTYLIDKMSIIIPPPPKWQLWYTLIKNIYLHANIEGNHTHHHHSTPSQWHSTHHLHSGTVVQYTTFTVHTTLTVAQYTHLHSDTVHTTLTVAHYTTFTVHTTFTVAQYIYLHSGTVHTTFTVAQYTPPWQWHITPHSQYTPHSQWHSGTIHHLHSTHHLNSDTVHIPSQWHSTHHLGSDTIHHLHSTHYIHSGTVAQYTTFAVHTTLTVTQWHNTSPSQYTPP